MARGGGEAGQRRGGWPAAGRRVGGWEMERHALPSRMDESVN